VNASAVERVELRPVHSHFVDLEKTKQIIKLNTLKLHCKYVYSLAGRDFVNAGPLYKMELRMNVSKTIGGSANCESDVTRKRTFVNIRCKYVAFMAAPNRHVRQTIRIVDAAQRCKN